MNANKVLILAIGVFSVGVWSSVASAAEALAGTTTITADPYPLHAAGWGPEVGNGLFYSRWAEDWAGLGKAGKAPRFKGIPLGNDAVMTLSAEGRLRYNTYENGELMGRKNYQQGQFRGVMGADFRFNPFFRVYGEVGTGQVDGQRHSATPNFQNDLSLQQLFVEVRGYIGSTITGVMAGRQEFADGPRQLLSLSDGPNLHRTWNGLRFYVHDENLRLGVFDFEATQLEGGILDERVNHGEHLQGINGGLVIAAGNGSNTFLDAFLLSTEKNGFRLGGQTGLDERDTYGLRLWGKQGNVGFDLTLAHQAGQYRQRDIDAWGLFAVQSLVLSGEGWKPRLTAHIDMASGGGADGDGKIKNFNPLYSSSNYLGEGQFLSLSNLFLVAPGIALSPSGSTSLSAEYGFAYRLNQEDAAYAGGMRAYAGTSNVSGRAIGQLLRMTASWSVSRELTFLLNLEHLRAGDVLRNAGLPSGSYGSIGATYRY